MIVAWTVDILSKDLEVIYYEWLPDNRYNLMIRVGEFDIVGTFHGYNNDHLLAIL